MNFKKFTFSVTLLIIAGIVSFAQQRDSVSLQTISDKTAKLNIEHPIEKVYLHFDKPYYAIGDTVWFKAYVTFAKNKDTLHMPSAISKIVWVDVINSKDSIVQTLRLPVTGGMAPGDVALAKPLYRQGNYHFRAYTRWMRNFDPAYFFTKTISVGNAIEKEVYTNISLSGSAKNNSAIARIHYYDADGRDLAGKKITWKIQSNDDETINKGKLTTDSKGNITIPISGKGDINTSTLFTAIDIGPKDVNTSFPLKHATATMDVQFFPESGNLVAGVRSKVAFKAINPNGLGVDVKGTITDNTGTVVVDFTSQHLGMGTFDLVPQSGKTYKANITFPDGSKSSYDLPAVKSYGITMSVVNTDPDKISLRIAADDQFLQANKGKIFYIVAQNSEFIQYTGQATLMTAMIPASIPKSKFVSGVVRLTLFNTTGDALAERSIFVQRNDQLNITLKTDKPSYSPRQKVTLNILTQKNAKPSQANLSLTVLDESKVPYNDNAETTILTSLLLTSDLKGYVEQPNYYFNNPNDKTNADLDVLMLTQGYTRFVYKDLLANKYPPNDYLAEQSIEIKGTLRNTVGTTLSGGSLTFEVKDKYITVNTKSDLRGNFKFSKLFFPDSAQATITAKSPYGSSEGLLVIPDKDPYLAATPNITAPDEVANIDSTLFGYLQNSKKQNSHILKEVVIKGIVQERKPSHADYGNLSGLSQMPNQTIPGEFLKGCSNLFDCLKSRANGLVYDEQTQSIFIRRDHDQGNNKPVQIYVNNIPVDYTNLQTMEPENVESVEVFYDDGVSSINRMTDTHGVLVINSKKNQKPKITPEQLRAFIASMRITSVPIAIKGYTMARIFYSPKYNDSGNTVMAVICAAPYTGTRM